MKPKHKKNLLAFIKDTQETKWKSLKNIILQSFEQSKDNSGSIALNIELIAGHAWKGNKRGRETVNVKDTPIFFGGKR